MCFNYPVSAADETFGSVKLASRRRQSPLQPNLCLLCVKFICHVNKNDAKLWGVCVIPSRRKGPKQNVHYFIDLSTSKTASERRGGSWRRINTTSSAPLSHFTLLCMKKNNYTYSHIVVTVYQPSLITDHRLSFRTLN